MKALLDILKLSTDYLEKKGVERPRRQAEEILSIVLKIPRLDLYLNYEKPLQEEELNRIRELLKRRGEGEPCQYLKGEVLFYNNRIQINHSVLIPRQETEILADLICKDLDMESLSCKVFLDLCTGSGCLALAIKKNFPDLMVYGSDKSPEACHLAKQNALLNNLDIEFLEGDFFGPFEGKQTDFIVCNPPYVSESEWDQLEREVRDYEPKMALVAGADGLDFYRRLAIEVKNYINRPAKLYLEIGATQGELVKKIFCSQGMEKGRVVQDWSGKDRFFFLEIE